MLTYLLKAPQAVAAKTLQWAVRSWFAIFFVGQAIFASYIILHYWWSAAQGRMERWNEATPHLYIEGAGFHNAVFALHIGIAALISLLGPLQLLPALRQYVPRFHRLSGRFYIFFAFAIGIDGHLV